MDYKTLMGYNNKKEKIVKNNKPSVTDLLREEFGKINEVGSAPQHKKFLKNIEKAEENLHKNVLKYKNFLQSQGLRDEGNEFSSKYVGFVGKFTHYTKTTWTKMLRKMI
jgi:hypothetical protein